MAVKTVQDHFESHNRLVEEFREHVRNIDAKKPPPPDMVTSLKEQTIGALRETLSGVEKGRAEVVERFDAKISTLRGEITRLEKEVEEERKRQAGSDKKKRPSAKKGGAARQPSKKAPKGGASSAEPAIPLEKIKGIGPSRARALEEHGIKDVAAFRETPTDELRKILGPMDYRELKTRSVALMKTAKKTKTEKASKQSSK